MTGKTTPRRSWAAPPLVQSPRCDLGPCRVSAGSAKLNGITLGPAAARRHGRTPGSVGLRADWNSLLFRAFLQSEAVWGGIGMSSKTYIGQTIILDGKCFQNATFESCTFIYSGSNEVSMRGCHFINPKFVFDGAAANTLLLLKGLYADGFQAVVETSLSARSGTSKPTRH